MPISNRKKLSSAIIKEISITGTAIMGRNDRRKIYATFNGMQYKAAPAYALARATGEVCYEVTKLFWSNI